MVWTVIKDGKRRCIVCKRDKALAEFHSYAYTTKQGKRSVRYSSRCKPCEAQRRRQRTERNSARQAEQSRLWRERNPGKVAENNRLYRESDHGRTKRARLQLRRWHTQRAAEGEYTQADIDRLFKAQKGKCAYCRSSLGKKYTIDHIKPVSRGGPNWPSNLQLTCKSCNCSKQHKDAIDYAQSLGMLV